MKPILYISGPYSADTLIERQQNILNAKRRFVAALATGEWWAVCPHTHTAELEMHLPDVDHDEWLKMDIAMLAGCDAVWMDSWCTKTVGVKLELVWAYLAGMPISTTSTVPLAKKFTHSNIDVYHEFEPQIYILYDMVSRGDIPDPKTYKGSALNARKPYADIIDADGVQYTRIAGMQRPASEIVDADTEQVTACESRARPQSDIIVAREK